MRVGCIGAGYVGLVTSALMAQKGHEVLCIEKDAWKISLLRQARVPFFEPGLEDILRETLHNGQLRFSTDITALGEFSPKAVLICVGTPSSEDGGADTRMVMEVVDQLAGTLEAQSVVVLKSTVPLGTYRRVDLELKAKARVPLYVANNPEFLREGSAVRDFLYPDRIVIGYKDEWARGVLEELYAPFFETSGTTLWMDPASAELVKYASNAFLALKISFVNLMGDLAAKTGGDIWKVAQGVGMDKRIGPHFLSPGLGYGGSCLPKDTRALISTLESLGLDQGLFRSVERINASRIDLALEVLKGALVGPLEGATLGVWGAAFKAHTDDVREAPSLMLIQALLDNGTKVKVYDPKAMDKLKGLLGRKIEYAKDAYDAASDVDALVLATEWPEFLEVSFDRVKGLMRQPVVLDCRSQLRGLQLESKGFCYATLHGPATPPATVSAGSLL